LGVGFPSCNTCFVVGMGFAQPTTCAITLPIFQFSALPLLKSSSLSPRNSDGSYEKGGKTHTKRFHMVNWNTIKATKLHEGLGIEDPTLMNIALGAKLLWRLILRSKNLWKRVLLHKYFSGSRLRCLEDPPEAHPSSQIWHLLKASLPLIQIQLTWVPGNGKKIMIWKNNITGNPPLLKIQNLLPL
jgi:hypothetical protein